MFNFPMNLTNDLFTVLKLPIMIGIITTSLQFQCQTTIFLKIFLSYAGNPVSNGPATSTNMHVLIGLVINTDIRFKVFDFSNRRNFYVPTILSLRSSARLSLGYNQTTNLSVPSSTLDIPPNAVFDQHAHVPCHFASSYILVVMAFDILPRYARLPHLSPQTFGIYQKHFPCLLLSSHQGWNLSGGTVEQS